LFFVFISTIRAQEVPQFPAWWKYAKNDRTLKTWQQVFSMSNPAIGQQPRIVPEGMAHPNPWAREETDR
jgi:hypothetical protein